jgi:DNA-directed RNA polymerase
VHQDLPGDLYKYIADFVWEIIERQVAEIDKPSFDACNLFIDELLTIKRQVRALDVKDPIRTSLIENLKMVREKNKDLMAISGPIYWSRFKDNKARRKVVKRNVMTIPYGGTAYGLGQQQISDARKHGIDLLNDMEHKWGSYLGRLVFESCKESMEKPMKLLAMFEAAGKAAEQRGEFLSWTLPLTNFPVVQYYVEGVVKKMWVQYGPPRGPRLSTGYYENTLQLNICFIENTVPSKGKQAQGASPNAIHSLDAAHLMLTIHQCSFPVTTIHDSYGCLLADMPQLFRIVREAFVTLYEQDPLKHLVEDVDGNLEGISFGNLDITAIYGSEYGFC